MRSRAFVWIAVVASATTAALPAEAGTAPRKTVGIYDNFYLPAKLTRLKPGTIVVWKWPDDAGDVHDVKLKEKPRKAKRFWSAPASVGYKFKQKLTVPGKYHIICTLHEEMEMTITVRKPAG
jgi:plastocyanin